MTILESTWKMKLGEQLLRNARAPQNIKKVKFYEDLPARLRDRVSGKGDKVKGEGCLQEFSLLINCLQMHDYENKMCKKEVGDFDNCYSKYMTNKRVSKEQQLKGIITPDTKVLKHKQLNNFLKRFPQPA